MSVCEGYIVEASQCVHMEHTYVLETVHVKHTDFLFEESVKSNS